MIIHAEAFGESQDLHLIPAVLHGAKENMGAIGCGEDYFAGKTLTADSNPTVSEVSMYPVGIYGNQILVLAKAYISMIQ